MPEIKDSDLKNMSKSELLNAGIRDLGFFIGKKYCISDLEYIVKNTPIKLVFILETQHVNAEFCKNYILNKKYIIHEVDDLTIDEIIDYQPHLKVEDLLT